MINVERQPKSKITVSVNPVVFDEILSCWAKSIVSRCIADNSKIYANGQVCRSDLECICIERFVYKKPYAQICLISIWDYINPREYCSRYSIPTIKKWCKLLQPYITDIVIEL